MSKLSENFKFKDRPPNPWEFTKPAPVATNMAWHHVIPFFSLRDVWSRLCDVHVDTAMPAARVAIRQYLLLLNSRLAQVDELIDRMRAETTQKTSRHNPLKPLGDGEILLLKSTVAFPAWDLVEGPGNRGAGDDPENRFDRFSVGLTPEEAHRMSVLHKLDEQLATFLAQPFPSPRALIDAIAIPAMIDLKRVRQPIYFRSEMWVRNGVTSKWSKAS